MVLNKRIIREFKSNWIRYTGLFLLVVLSVSLIVGFADSTDSIVNTVEKAAAENDLESGNFVVLARLDEETEQKIEEAGFLLAKAFYYDAVLSAGRTLRVFEVRTGLNRLTVLEGKTSINTGDIITDRHFGEKNIFEIGSIINIDSKPYTVSGYGITPDYTLVLKDNSELLADPEHFGIAFIAKEDFEKIDTDKINYGYSFKYQASGLSSVEKKTLIGELKDILKDSSIITSFTKTEDNQRTQSYGEDVAINKSIAIILGTILLFIMAFIFSLSIIHIIDSESPVIGAMYALGYVKKEIIRHYMILPVVLVAIASFFGTILGFGVFSRFVADSSYQYFSYPHLQIIYPLYLILYGIAAPIGITFAVNYFMLSKRLHCTPLKLLRKDIKKDRVKALNLKHFKFLTKFRIRVFLRGIGNNVTLFIGLVFATFLLLLSFGVRDSINYYVTDVTENAPCRYTYILNQPVELEGDQQAEKGVTHILETYYDKLDQNMKITLQGIKPDSAYYKFDIKEGEKGLYISRAVGKKFGLKAGDSMKLLDSRKDITYELPIIGVVDYTGGLYVFMNYGEMNGLFGDGEDYFNTYFSNSSLELKEEYVYSRITAADLGKVAQNMSKMMESMIFLLIVTSVILYIIITYLLLKMLIDKNASNVSLIKIFGYSNREINKLYLGSTFYTVLISVLAAIPLDYKVFSMLWPDFITNIAGFIFIKINPLTYVTILLTSLISYLATQELLKLRLRKISFTDILKNRE